MANGVYGTNIPSLIADENISKYVDIFYSYSPTRNSTDVNNTTFTKVDDTEVSSWLKNVVGDTTSTVDTIVEGLYNLKLPMSTFGAKGFYTIYIKPKEVEATILDVSTLRDFSDVRGIVFDLNDLPTYVLGDARTNNSLVGYRIIYINDDGTRSSDARIVTSNNKCEPVASVNTNSNAKSYSYIYNENATYTFVTVTPSLPLSFKSSSTPFIGKATQKVYLVNTLFEPVMIELEMTENDADTIAELIDGSQLRDLNNGLITTFNSDNQIISQHEVSTLKETATGTPQYEVKEKKTDNIDFTQTISDKIE